MTDPRGPPKYPEASEKPFYRARSEICVNAAGQCIGDGLFAGPDYKAGAYIFAVRQPLIGSLDTQRLGDTCANCYVWTEGSAIGSRLYVKEGTKVQACAGCKRSRYCSKRCQKDAWVCGHKHMCKTLKPVFQKELPKAVLATVDILVRRKYGLIPDDAWKLLLRLDTHIDDFKQNGSYGNIELMAMGASQFSLTQDMFDLDFVAAMYARVLSNCLTLVTPTFDPLGIFVDPIMCQINHSCDPNAYIIMDGAEVAIRTLKPIKKDEEIFISYIDTTNPYARRQSELKSRWFFTCKCSKCQKGTTLQEDEWAIEPKNLTAKWKESADIIIERADFCSAAENYVGESIDEKRAAALQGKAFDDYETEQEAEDPAEAIKIIEDGMRLCYQSGLWKVFRQPYAALRDDLIINMLSAGNYQIAWSQCAKRYRYILPKLFPVKAHPIRVVQVWQMAMLALYLAGEGGVTPGVDMGLIAYMLVLEVDHLVSSSHGENTVFARSVRRKFREMVSEIGEKLGPNADQIMVQQVPNQRSALMEMGDWMQY